MSERDSLRDATADASREEPPRMLGTANIAVVDYWRSRALQAERKLLEHAERRIPPVTSVSRHSLNAGNARPAQRAPYTC